MGEEAERNDKSPYHGGGSQQITNVLYDFTLHVVEIISEILSAEEGFTQPKYDMENMIQDIRSQVHVEIILRGFFLVSSNKYDSHEEDQET